MAPEDQDTSGDTPTASFRKAGKAMWFCKVPAGLSPPPTAGTDASVHRQVGKASATSSNGISCKFHC